MNDLNYTNLNGVDNVQNVSPAYQYALKQQIDINAEALKDGIRTANKMAIADHMHYLDLQKEEKRAELSEKNYTRRQLATRSVIENADGYLIMELIFPDGKHSFSESICPERFFRAKYYFASDSVPEEDVLNIF
ncbi:MAG: hypothetical protein NC489_40885, partial [Ruminococcus flavefaciens]|nr:hypothetical protein [Ruminococcus flavefaciens]